MGLTLRERVRMRDGRDLHAAGARTSRADSCCVTSSCGKKEPSRRPLSRDERAHRVGELRVNVLLEDGPGGSTGGL